MTRNERIKKLLRSMDCIDAWAKDALEHGVTFGNNYRRALQIIQLEAQAALKHERKRG